MSGAPKSFGVVGAGTMGAGIAQLGCLAGFETRLHDPFPDALERGAERVRDGLASGVQRGRWSESEAADAERRLTLAAAIEELAPCDAVVEAAPERPELKRELFATLARVCGPSALLASNTSSILISSLAAAAGQPERVVGMHFFNPPPVMRLLEVVAGADTDDGAVARARAIGEAMGKHVIVSRDGPGFLVNRCGRPFASEALRAVQERIATPAEVDRVCRLGGGFRMGPFELMDLVGIDVGLEVARSFDAQSFGEPRWKPHPLQARMVAAGRLGRKTGRGWYDYAGARYRDDDPEPPAPGGGGGRTVAIDGRGALARELRARAAAAGFDARSPEDFGAERPELLVDASVPAPAADLGIAPGDVPLAVVCADRSLAARDMPEACGFNLLPPLEGSRLVELTRLASCRPAAVEATERFFSALGFERQWVGDAPGLVLGRIVCQLVNEAAFALGEGVGSPQDLDAGMKLGLNHPRGPLEWGRAIGLEHVLATVDGLWRERHEERYRAAPLLRRAVATETALAAEGDGDR